MTNFGTEQVPGEGRRALSVDIFKPGTTNGVGVILLHGGGWASGDRRMMHGYAEVLAKMGFVVLAAEYRLLHEAPWPSQIEDVRDIVRWARAQSSRLGIAPDKIALQGYSAGAHIALMVAGTQSGSGNEGAVPGNPSGAQVAAVVSFFAPARLATDPVAMERPPLALLLQGGGEEAARAASPIHFVNSRFPSTLILGGMADYMQPLDAGLDLLSAFVDAGAEVEFHYLHSQRHEFAMTPGMIDGVMAEVAFFYRRTLIDRAALEAEARAINPFARASSKREFVQMMAVAQPR
ncbi:alpha/beta hydrolase [Paraburkholderia dilworthii]|uniref:alpha/beta hydrolase n=1 Tax=Paraburkholderia dilworthii TaxID=948106 RepID=UPI001268C9A9|nr:alpha/beta hydrolase [Paraburkholderia dilworthii]